MAHDALDLMFRRLIDSMRPSARSAPASPSPRGRSGIRSSTTCCSPTCPADVRRRWDQRGGVREVKRPSNKCNGMTYDADLNLIVCEHATSSLVRDRRTAAAR